MKCKNCGGELSFQNGNFICKSCGAIFSIDSIYEKIDVYICYEEYDDAGRRTRDSIIAQEVYRKLEDNKISTFCERVSTDGMTGANLETGKIAAIHQAKIILVLGTSIENFNVIEEKYSTYFTGKIVIPFCVDINPHAIPKTFGKIQAMSYATIGWEKDLIKGIYTILGREQSIDTSFLLKRGKAKHIVVVTIVAVAIIIAFVVGWFCLRPNDSTPRSKETVVPLTHSEIYKNAQILLNSGKYLDAACEFNKILNYKDSSGQIKKIYDRYDGYYQDDEADYSLYINIIDGKTVEFFLEKTIEYKMIKAEGFLFLENNKVTGIYEDSLLNEGSLKIELTDEYISVDVSTDITRNEISFGSITVQFHIKHKSDRPAIKTVTRELLLDWMNSPTSINDIKISGYELEYLPVVGEQESDFWVKCKIVNTDITIVTADTDSTDTSESNELDKRSIVAIIAPVNLLFPEKIGERVDVFFVGEIVCIPNVIAWRGPGFITSVSAYNPESSIIKENSYVGLTSKN